MKKINHNSLKNLVDIYKPNYLFVKKIFLNLMVMSRFYHLKIFDLIKKKNFFKINYTENYLYSFQLQVVREALRW